MTTTALFGTPKSATTIAPIAYLVDQIGGTQTQIFIPRKSNPHLFDPKPSHLKKLMKTRLYFAIGLPIEKIWIKKITSINPNLRVVWLSEVKEEEREDGDHIHHKDHHYHSEGHHHHSEDPHIWTSIATLKEMAHTIADTLCQIDNKECERYRSNEAKLIAHLAKTKTKIERILEKMPSHRTFVTQHPSWSAFADEFTLRQHSIEKEGKEPTLKTLRSLAKTMKSLKIKTIIIQPEIPHKGADVLAKMLGLKIKEVSPLAYQITNELITLAKSIADE